jgi:hypothetical protein
MYVCTYLWENWSEINHILPTRVREDSSRVHSLKESNRVSTYTLLRDACHPCGFRFRIDGEFCHLIMPRDAADMVTTQRSMLSQ